MNEKRSGIVLFVVVIVIAIVSLAAYSFSILMRSELHAARIRGDQLQSQMLTESGISYLNSWAEASRSERDSAGGLDVNESLFRNVLVDGYIDPLRPGMCSIVRPRPNNGELAEIDQFPIHNDSTSTMPPLTFGVVNESSKLHLQTVLAWEVAEPGAGRSALLSIPGMTVSIADAILDWIDEDSDVREFGAENDYYQSLDPSREPANQVPRSLDELLLIRGVSNERLFGFDRNRNFTIEPFEQPADSDPNDENSDPNQRDQSNAGGLEQIGTTERRTDQRDPELLPEPWIRFLTVTSAERNVDYFGRPRIQINQSDLSLLHKQLESRFGEEVANFILSLRQLGPYDGNVPPKQLPVPNVNTSKAAVIEIDSLASLLTAKIAIGEENPSVYASPWAPGREGSSNRFAEFSDAVTISETHVVVGRINLTSATSSVLAAIPMLTSDQVERIVSSRNASSTGLGTSSERMDPYWLVEEKIVDVKTFERLSNFLTMGGDVFSAQIVGYYVDVSSSDRVEVIVDGTDQSPRPLYYADLTRYGRGFSLGQLAPPVDAAANTPSMNGIIPGEQTLGR